MRNLNAPSADEPPEQIFKGQRAEYPVTIEFEIDPKRQYLLSFVNAPVFDERQEVAFTLGLMGFMTTFKGTEVERMGRILREACDRITNFAGRRTDLPS